MEQEDKFIIYYSKNNYLPLLLIADIMLIFIAVLTLMSKYVNKAVGITFLVITVAAGIFVVSRIVKAKGQKKILLMMDKNGIDDRNPFDAKGFIPWENVESISAHTGTRGSRSLLLTLKEAGAFKTGKKVYVNLNFANVSTEYALKKAEEFRKRAV
ncbi:MAG: hypothetical protein IJM62_04655 [Lachnospiraceae bacterium]|nr:hypothetical protein [Lachnospiraceae bacterium]